MMLSLVPVTVFAVGENNGKLSFGGIDVTRGKIEYKFNENDDFTAVGTTTDSESQTQSYDSVDLGENSSITVKISPAAKTATTEGYRIDTVYGVKLWKNGQIDKKNSSENSTAPPFCNAYLHENQRIEN